MEYQTTLPASWEICMQVKKLQLEPDMKQQTGSKLGMEYIKQSSGLYEAQVGIKIAGRNINNLRYTGDTTLMAESEEELVSWWKWKRRVKKLA